MLVRLARAGLAPAVVEREPVDLGEAARERQEVVAVERRLLRHRLLGHDEQMVLDDRDTC